MNEETDNQNLLFDVPAEKPLPERLRVAYLMYGRAAPGLACGGCVHFKRLRHNGPTWAKCVLTYQSHGVVTDWRARWAACGRYEANHEKKKMRRSKKAVAGVA